MSYLKWQYQEQKQPNRASKCQISHIWIGVYISNGVIMQFIPYIPDVSFMKKEDIFQQLLTVLWIHSRMS